MLFCNDTATTEIYTLALHDALPIFFHSAVDGTQIRVFVVRRPIFLCFMLCSRRHLARARRSMPTRRALTMHYQLISKVRLRGCRAFMQYPASGEPSTLSKPVRHQNLYSRTKGHNASPWYGRIR